MSGREPKENKMSARLEEPIWQVTVVNDKTQAVTVVNEGLTHAQAHTIRSKMMTYKWRRIVVRKAPEA